MKRALSEIFYFKLFCFPIIFLFCFASCVLPVVSNYTSFYVSKRLNKYDQLVDDFIYRDETYESYLSNSNCFDNNGCCAFQTEFKQLDSQVIFIACFGNPSLYGVPYFDTFISLDNVKIESGNYYTNSELFEKSLTINGSDYAYGGKVRLSFPFLNMFFDSPLSKEVVFYISNTSIELSDDVQVVYDSNKIIDNSFVYYSTETGKSLKMNYLKDNKSIVSFSSNIVLMTYSLFFVLELFGCLLLFNKFKKTEKIKDIYYICSRFFVFSESFKRWLTIMIIPTLLGLLLSFIIRMSTGIFSISILDFFVIISTFSVATAFTTFRSFGKRGKYD